MQSKLQELTDKIYQEGVERGTQDAEKIVAQARVEAESILKKANAEAEKIVAQANQKAEELRTNIQSELKLSVRQSINALKQQIANLVVAQTVNTGIKDILQDTTYLKEIVLTVVQNWNPSVDSNINVSVLLPSDKEKELQKYFETEAKGLLSKGLKIGYSDNIKNGFEIGPADGSYKISFTDDDFANFFSDFLRPKLAAILFEGEH